MWNFRHFLEGTNDIIKFFVAFLNFETFVKWLKISTCAIRNNFRFDFIWRIWDVESRKKRFRFGLNLENSSGFEFFNPKKIQSSRRMFTKNPELNIREGYIQNINLFGPFLDWSMIGPKKHLHITPLGLRGNHTPSAYR